MCATVLGFCPGNPYVQLDSDEYSASVLSDKPSFLSADTFLNDLYAGIQADPSPRPTLKMVHFTDVHVDLQYAAGSNKKCKSTCCCRAEFGFPKDKSEQAGRLGTYGCDIPMDVITKLGEFIN